MPRSIGLSLKLSLIVKKCTVQEGASFQFDGIKIKIHTKWSYKREGEFACR